MQVATDTETETKNELIGDVVKKKIVDTEYRTSIGNEYLPMDTISDNFGQVVIESDNDDDDDDDANAGDQHEHIGEWKRSTKMSDPNDATIENLIKQMSEINFNGVSFKTESLIKKSLEDIKV